MISDLTQFINFREKASVVHLAGDKKMPSRGRGDTKWLKDVLYVPGLKFELISISKLNQEGMRTVFENNKVYVINKNGQTVISGFLKNGLYFVDNTSESIIKFNNNKKCNYNINELNIDNESAAEEFCNDNNIETFKISKESVNNIHTQHNNNFNKINGGTSFEPTTQQIERGMLTTSTEVYMIDNTKSQYKGMNNDLVNFNDEKLINSKDPGNAHACSSRIKTAEKLYDCNDHENIKNFQSKKAESQSAVKRPSLNMAVNLRPSLNMASKVVSPNKLAYSKVVNPNKLVYNKGISPILKSASDKRPSLNMAVKRPSLNMAQINPLNNKMVVMNESPSKMAYNNKKSINDEESSKDEESNNDEESNKDENSHDDAENSHKDEESNKNEFKFVKDGIITINKFEYLLKDIDDETNYKNNKIKIGSSKSRKFNC